MDTVDVTLAEVSIRLTGRRRDPAEVAAVIDTIVDATELSRGAILPRGPEEAKVAGTIRRDLRKVKDDASLVEACVLSVTRARGQVLVSGDEAYQGQPDVVAS